MRSNSAQLSFTIRPLENSDLAAAAVICAEAMLDNPIHIRVFGQASLARNRRLKRFFPGLLAYVYRKGALSLLGSIRLAIWLSTWARIDPIVPHGQLGFSILSTPTILGASSWVMLRPAEASA